MKKLIVPIVALAALGSLAGCSGSSQREKQLQAENDSLVIVATQAKAEMDELLGIINDVEAGFAQIRNAENFLTVTAQGNGEITQTTRERIQSDMQMVTEALKNNREQLDKLQKLYDASKSQSAAMKKTIAGLKEELETKTKTILTLQDELAKKDAKIGELTQSVTELAGTVDALSATADQQASEIKAQDKELNTGWYVFGYKNELKDEGILTGGGLFKESKLMEGNFNKDYFTKVDIRTLKEIPLKAKKAKMLSSMPEGSYEFKKDGDGYLTLVITDYKTFWSVSKYLVVQVD
jgi:chromosome segregation ATPase